MEKVSIGMPSYNGERFIARALDVLLSQTYKNIELIVSDDASSDRTFEIASGYAARDARIKLFRQEKNIGLVKNFDFVLKRARGEYFMWAGQDDWWDESFVEKMVAALAKNPRASVAMSHFQAMDEAGNARETPLGEHDYNGKSYFSVYKTMIQGKGNPIFEYGLFRRDYLLKLFRRLKPRCFEDTLVLMCELALSAHLVSVREMLHKKYRHPRALTKRHYVGAYARERFMYTKYLFTMLFWLLTSRVIPFRRKFLIFGPWLSRVWQKRGKIFAEIFSFGHARVL